MTRWTGNVRPLSRSETYGLGNVLASVQRGDTMSTETYWDRFLRWNRREVGETDAQYLQRYHGWLMAEKASEADAASDAARAQQKTETGPNLVAGDTGSSLVDFGGEPPAEVSPEE